MKFPPRSSGSSIFKRIGAPVQRHHLEYRGSESFLDRPKTGASQTDKGILFDRVVSHPPARTLIGLWFGQVLSEGDRSDAVARAFKTASEQTGAFEARDAKK